MDPGRPFGAVHQVVAEAGRGQQRGVEGERVGTPAPFVQAVVKGLSLEQHDEIYRQHWLKIGKLAAEK